MLLNSKNCINAFKQGVIMKEKMSKAGYTQGDMNPHVEDYQKPSDDFAERGFSKTTEYIERQDRSQDRMAKGLNKQSYQGRYS